MTDWEELKPAIYSEVAFVLLTGLAAAFQAWPIFAFMALLCVLMPLWIAAISVAVIAAHGFEPKEP